MPVLAADAQRYVTAAERDDDHEPAAPTSFVATARRRAAPAPGGCRLGPGPRTPDETSRGAGETIAGGGRATRDH